MSGHDEILEVVDEQGSVIRLAQRSELHSDPSLIHRVVHVLVFNSKGQLLLQKRSMNKDVAAGKWDTSVGGHVNPGEGLHEAAIRELYEELGITGQKMEFLYSYLFRNWRESELVYTFSCVYDGSITFNKDEIDEVAFWDLQRIRETLQYKENPDSGIFSRHFEKEIRNYLSEIYPSGA